MVVTTSHVLSSILNEIEIIKCVFLPHDSQLSSHKLYPTLAQCVYFYQEDKYYQLLKRSGKEEKRKKN